MNRPRVLKGLCAMPECKEPIRTAGLCGACYSWWARVRWLQAGDLVAYMRTAKFRSQRMVSRLSNFGIGRWKAPPKRKRAA